MVSLYHLSIYSVRLKITVCAFEGITLLRGEQFLKPNVENQFLIFIDCQIKPPLKCITREELCLWLITEVHLLYIGFIGAVELLHFLCSL